MAEQLGAADKSFAILMESLRHINNPYFSTVIFRRTSKQVLNPGGLWDTSHEIFPYVGGIPKESSLEWNFPSGARVKFAHMEYEKNKIDWQGSQVPLIGWDELTHFSWGQFSYMFSRNRSTCGVRPYIRATTNPDSESWVRKFIDWWINPETGLAIPDRSGKIRWFSVVNDETFWSDSKDDLIKRFPDSTPRSLSFVSSTIYDNKILLEKDPGYLANLQSMPRYEREQLLNGNWNIRPTAGAFFQKSYFEVIKAAPKNTKKVRYWDRAATKKTETNDPDYTVGILLEKDSNNVLYVTDIVRIQDSPLGVQTAIKNTASQDGPMVRIGIEEDPGQAGKAEADLLIRMLLGYRAKTYRATKDKISRSSPVSAQAEAGNIKVLAASWNDAFFKELENFPDGSHDDIVDALSGAFMMFTEDKYSISQLTNF
jgi:predicted phage terminase large subunit-like protein